MIDMHHPLVLLATRLPWSTIEAALLPKFAHQDRAPKTDVVAGLSGAQTVELGGGVSRAERPRLPIRLIVGLLMPPPDSMVSVPNKPSTVSDPGARSSREDLSDSAASMPGHGCLAASTGSGSIIDCRRARKKSSVAIPVVLENSQEPESSCHAHSPHGARVHAGCSGFAGPTT